MKMTIIISLIFLVSSSAQDTKAEKLAKKKTHVLQNLDKKTVEIQKAKTCVTGATTGKGVKACIKKLHESLKSLREGRKVSWGDKNAENNFHG